MNPPPASVASHHHASTEPDPELMTTKSTAATVMRGSCTCGANSFEVKTGVPMQRFYCHCLYCQQFMGKPYTDVTFVRAKNVVINGEHATFNNPKLLPSRLRPRARLAVREPRQGPFREVRQARPRPVRRLRAAPH